MTKPKIDTDEKGAIYDSGFHDGYERAKARFKQSPLSKMNKEEKKAYEWALTPPYESVVAYHSQTLALFIKYTL